MGICDGFYWCRQIREISEIPLIYISSRSEDNDKIMAIAQSGDDYVEKPFRLEILRTKIEAILRRTYQYRVKDRVYLQEKICFEPDITTREELMIEKRKQEQQERINQMLHSALLGARIQSSLFDLRIRGTNPMECVTVPIDRDGALYGIGHFGTVRA